MRKYSQLPSAIAAVPLLLYVVGRLGLGGGLALVAALSMVVLLPLVANVLRYRVPADLGMVRDGIVVDGEALPNTHIATSANGFRLLWTSTIAFSLFLVMQIGFISHHVALAEPILGMFGNSGYR